MTRDELLTEIRSRGADSVLDALRLAPQVLLSRLIESLDVAPYDSHPNTRQLARMVGKVVPDDHARQVSATDMIPEVVPARFSGKVVDLGCGKGQSRSLFVEHCKNAQWVGLEVEGSPNLAPSGMLPEGVLTYDGNNIPLENNSVAYVYSKQVFEHVREPERLLREIHRVLEPGGAFFGSVAGLEPYHFFSMFNFTPYGWYVVLRDAKLVPEQLRPGVDGLSLALRHISADKGVFPGMFRGPSILNAFFQRRIAKGESARQANLRMLMFAGHIVFVARKPNANS